ncbi:unnamed protein product [Aspergillus oryzae]|nr:unnamed protein product [Aspergillus oryzae]GMF86390.1 unnamed protein product [Aspergillus oryzae]
MTYDPENAMGEARADAPVEAEKEHEATQTTVKESTLGYDNSSDPSRRDSYRPTKLQIVQYIANFSDGFQNSLANPTNVIFKKLLGTDGYPSEMQTRISNSLLIGAILGVLALGYTSDMFSRRAGLLFTSGLVAIGTLMSTLALQVHPTYNMLWYFVIVRGIAGFGVGGEYPPSAAAGIEESDDVRKIPAISTHRTEKLTLIKDHNIRTTAIWQVILGALPVPGVIVGAWLTNAIGRRYTGILGFAGYMVLGFVIGGTFPHLSKNMPAFVVLYGLLQALGHMGPGATIGLISTESFPTAMRGMGYSIATAFGRTGAAVGTQCFTPLQERAGKQSTFYLAGGIAILAMIVYWFLPESSELNLEEEDRDLSVFLAENGFPMEKA